jgi:hypothetical protein
MEKFELPPYSRGSANARALQVTIDELLRELPPEDAAALERVTAKEGEQGIEPVVTTIIITIVTNVGTEIAIGAWRRLLAKIKGRLGEDAIGEQEEDK